MSVTLYILFLRFFLEDICQTIKTVQTSQTSSKIFLCVSYFTLFTVFVNVVKRGQSCLMYYLKSQMDRYSVKNHFSIT